MDAVAVDGTTFRACLPDAALENPRILSEGSLMSSISFLPPPSVRVRASSRFRSSSVTGASDKACFSSGAKRLDAVIEAVDEYPAAVVLHGGQKLSQHHRGIGRPVSIVAAVEFPVGAIDGEIETCDAADAEVQLLLAGGVYRAVADEPYVGPEEFFVRCDDLLQSGRTCLLLAFEEEFEIDVRRRSFEPIERGEHGDDGTFVVGGSAGVETIALQCGREWRRLPLARIDRLAVVMRVEHDRAAGIRRGKFGEDGGRRSRLFEQSGSKAATLEGPGEPVGIPADVRGIGGDIRDRQKLLKLAQDLLLAGEQKER